MFCDKILCVVFCWGSGLLTVLWNSVEGQAYFSACQDIIEFFFVYYVVLKLIDLATSCWWWNTRSLNTRLINTLGLFKRTFILNDTVQERCTLEVVSSSDWCWLTTSFDRSCIRVVMVCHLQIYFGWRYPCSHEF